MSAYTDKPLVSVTIPSKHGFGDISYIGRLIDKLGTYSLVYSTHTWNTNKVPNSFITILDESK